ncbi:Cytochrome P450 [Canna indica]|uniref:Cytochrome P450 n=1 Tax=Canna indica TaxID=4628 RepID=A0AAQ3KY44_9LILI|nr:Cytochrome P450 [Canna indica]
MSLLELDVTSSSSCSPILVVSLIAFFVLCFFPGGLVWVFSKAHVCSIPSSSGFVSALSDSAAHCVLAGLAHSLNVVDLMAFSVSFTRFVVSSHPNMAKEILNSSAFTDRPIKESAYELLFHRAMGFRPLWQVLEKFVKDPVHLLV